MVLSQLQPVEILELMLLPCGKVKLLGKCTIVQGFHLGLQCPNNLNFTECCTEFWGAGLMITNDIYRIGSVQWLVFDLLPSLLFSGFGGEVSLSV